ncbi:Gfo/Idh/MocA family protein [Arthrobacter pascens]|uniref:Gfo/Idh/MocA family protein n=1 Tax=Arthrobacter pascens TaxID=1677 RepID=UPI00196A9F9F|nr:Gfo/Idh/MocA family oxidoreductase [Arthrobacter pascens]MBN3499857.1 Gfo/Idh/MocA family oxidoreductase [Arthrobacter pascens]
MRVIGVGFDHMHIGDQLQTAIDHPDTAVVGLIGDDLSRVSDVAFSLNLDVPSFGSLKELDALISVTDPDIAFVCTTTAAHADVVQALASAGIHVILEKPFADSLEAVDRMISSSQANGTLLTVNWPLAWLPSHRTAKRLIAEGSIGDVQAVHFYDGNRGPLFHSHGKVETSPTTEEKASSWFYSSDAGGGSLRDYLGYGVTLGTWFRNGGLPESVTADWFIPEGLEVDEQSVVIARYATGLSVFETRWGTLSDPWSLQPSPRCGFVITGATGSITSWDYDVEVTLTRGNGSAPERIGVDEIALEDRTALANVVAHLRTSRPLDSPLSAATSRIGHAIVEAAVRGAETGQRVRLTDLGGSAVRTLRDQSASNSNNSGALPKGT